MAGVPVQVIYDPDGSNTDITDSVIFSSVRLDFQMAALPGTWQATVSDPTRTLDFTTGKRILWKLDGQVFYGGFVSQVSRSFAFPADNTNPLSSVKTREFVLRGVDYNILFDKRVLRDPTNYVSVNTSHMHFTGTARYDGYLIKSICDNLLDLPTWLDTNTEVGNVNEFPVQTDPPNAGLVFDCEPQGSTWRAQMDEFYKLADGIYYIRPFGTGAQLLYRALEDNVAPYVLSDKPTGAEQGFRELDYLIDAANMVNEAYVWGGSEFGDAITGAPTVFGTYANSTSISNHGRWQWAESHFGETNWGGQARVSARAKSLVTGQGGIGGSAIGQRGLENPNQSFRLAWHQRNIPKSGGHYQFIYPGDLTTLNLYVFGSGGSPRVVVLPCRSISVSFPGNDPTGDSHVRFDGVFSLQPDDPYTLWNAVARRRRQVTT